MTAPTALPLTPLRGWAGATGSLAQVVEARTVASAASVAQVVRSRPPRGVLARGGGCSYGDAALNGGGVILSRPGGTSVRMDPGSVSVRAGAGATFTEVLAATVPHRLTPAVLPGTRHLTVGGAVAADVHGKNHRQDGSLGSWIESFELVTADGHVRTVDRSSDPDLFRATVGGMGLTGVITGARLRLTTLPSSRLDVETTREDDLDAVLARLDGARTRYAVAWVDGTSRGRSLGRGVVDLADPTPATDAPQAYRAGYAPRVLAAPTGLVGHSAAKAFNTAWFHTSPRHRQTSVGFNAFYHRLDALSGWNRGLGPYGFLQYQFVVPLAAVHVLSYVLERVSAAHAPCFLGTLKRFGPGNGHPLSFPIEGWCLALDIAVKPRDPTLAPVLDDLDRVVAEAGGRVYLAKDGRLRPDYIRQMYPQMDAWLDVKARVDPDGVFTSDLGRRLGLSR